MANTASPLTGPADAPALQLGTELTIGYAAVHRDALFDALQARPGTLQLDLSAVSDFDSSGVQLLLSARRSLAERGDALHILAASPAVADALALFGLAALLAAPDAAH